MTVDHCAHARLRGMDYMTMFSPATLLCQRLLACLLNIVLSCNISLLRSV